MDKEQSDQKCRHLGHGAKCSCSGGLAPTNAEMTVDEECRVIYYCIANSCHASQQSCSGYESQESKENKPSQ